MEKYLKVPSGTLQSNIAHRIFFPKVHLISGELQTERNEMFRPHVGHRAVVNSPLVYLFNTTGDLVFLRMFRVLAFEGN